MIGNPPFLGNRKIRSELGHDYADALQRAYAGLVRGRPDLVCYWFAKAGQLLAKSVIQRAGLVATNSIRGGTNRAVLARILEDSTIFDAWSDEPWVVEGAAVRVSLVCIAGRGAGFSAALDGAPVTGVNADLTAGTLDLTKALKVPGTRALRSRAISNAVRSTFAVIWPESGFAYPPTPTVGPTLTFSSHGSMVWT